MLTVLTDPAFQLKNYLGIPEDTSGSPTMSSTIIFNKKSFFKLVPGGNLKDLPLE
jgi:hypothetical protein